MSYHSYDIREIDPYDMGIRSKFQNHSPEIRHDRKNPSNCRKVNMERKRVKNDNQNFRLKNMWRMELMKYFSVF
jgi:hypothetical protein